jgi:hypothetical protein
MLLFQDLILLNQIFVKLTLYKQKIINYYILIEFINIT